MLTPQTEKLIEGGEWALKNLPAEYRALIADAMEEYAGGGEAVCDKARA